MADQQWSHAPVEIRRWGVGKVGPGAQRSDGSDEQRQELEEASAMLSDHKASRTSSVEFTILLV